MLFDLQGKRKRFIQVIYAFLALLLGVGLVGLGIGGDANGGIFDALGIGDDGSTGDAQFEQELDDANATLQTDPENVAALLTVARYSYLQGQQQLSADENGQPVLSDEARASYEDSVTAWEQYLDAKGSGKLNDEVASLVLQAYQNVAFSTQDLSAATRSLERGITAAEAVAEARPSASAWLKVAEFAYLSGDAKKGEQAGKEALAEATETEKQTVNQALRQYEQQGEAIAKQVKKAGPTQEDLEDPLGGLGLEGVTGGAGAAVPGGAGTAPAPAP